MSMMVCNFLQVEHVVEKPDKGISVQPSNVEMMMNWCSHIASVTEIGMDAQLLIKEGSSGLKYYYNMLLIVLLAEHDKGAADFHQRH
jgi:hypothetical protein